MPAYEPDEGKPPLRQVIYEAVEGVRPDVKITSNMYFGFDFSIPGSRYMIRLITEGEQDVRLEEYLRKGSNSPTLPTRMVIIERSDPSITSNIIIRWLLDRDPDMQFGEPAPKSNDGPSMHDLVIEDMKARKQFGLDKYGVQLQAFNGRKPLKDLYEELLDAVVYAKQRLIEDEARLSIPIPLDDETLHRMAEGMQNVGSSYTFETLARAGLEALLSAYLERGNRSPSPWPASVFEAEASHPQFKEFKERVSKDPAVQEAHESAKHASVHDQLDDVVRAREAELGNPSSGPLPASVSEVADKVVTWLDGMGDHAPGIHEAVANRLGVKLSAIAEIKNKATAWDEGEAAGRANADDGYPDPLVENPYREAQKYPDACPQCGSTVPQATKYPCSDAKSMVHPHKWHQEAQRR